MKISVVIPTRSPDPARLERVVEALAGQTLASPQWEVVLVDNGSTPPVSVESLRRIPASVSRVEESQPGLSRARRKGVAAARGRLLVFVDDDVLLAADYLETAWSIFVRHPALGTAGGRIVPEFSAAPPAWFDEFAGLLALRSPSWPDVTWSHLPRGGVDRQAPSPAAFSPGPVQLPAWLPNGAGLLVRREAAEAWIRFAQAASGPEITDRAGDSLASGGDQDLVLSALRAGWHTGYFSALMVRHLIPPARLQENYLARLNHGIQRSWVHVLHRHGLNPWPPIARWTAPLRKSRAYLRSAAWKSPAHHIRWRGLCGRFDGLADIARQGNGLRVLN